MRVERFGARRLGRAPRSGCRAQARLRLDRAVALVDAGNRQAEAPGELTREAFGTRCERMRSRVVMPGHADDQRVGLPLRHQASDLGEARRAFRANDGERVREAIGLTTSKDILEAVGRGEGPQRMIVTLGYAGWSPGQLEHEISQNAWLTVEARDGIIFDLPSEERLPAAMELLGLDFARLSEEAGHA